LVKLLKYFDFFVTFSRHMRIINLNSINLKQIIMKKIFGLLAIMTLAVLVITPQTYAQTVNEKITVNTSDLTVDQLAKIKAEAEVKELQKKLETYGNWVGVGGEIGNAVKEGLTAVVDVADKFGKTDVGKFTLVMVAWKVMGKDVVQIVLGIFFFFIFSTVLIWLYKRLIVARKVMVENPGFLRYPKKYEVVKTELDGDGVIVVTIILILAFLVNIWITYSIMF
jgi:hypothetical protein